MLYEVITYDPYQGVVVLVRIVDGALHKGDKIRLMASNREYDVLRVGVFSPHPCEIGELAAGEVGFITAAIKVVQDAKVGGDILTRVLRDQPGVQRRDVLHLAGDDASYNFV